LHLDPRSASRHNAIKARPGKKPQTLDINQLAARITEIATGEPVGPPAKPEREKDPNAVALGRKGGLKGGPARARKLTPIERSAMAKKAAKARWKKEVHDCFSGHCKCLMVCVAGRVLVYPIVSQRQ